MAIEVGGAASSEFITATYSTPIQVGAGQTGTIFTIPCPSGKRLRLTGLVAVSGQENGVTLTIGAKTVITSKNLSNGNTTTNSFVVGCVGSAVAASSGAGYIESIVGDVDEAITLSKDAGSSTQAINYSYEVSQ